MLSIIYQTPDQKIEAIAQHFQCDEKVARQGMCRTFRGHCPNCGQHSSPSFYVSLTQEDQQILVNCLVCQDTASLARIIFADTGISISHKVVLNEHIQAVLDAVPFAKFENTRTAPTDLMVLMAHSRIMADCGQEIYRASVRQLALGARIGDATVLEAHKRLRASGWLDGEDRGDIFRANSYSLKIPKSLGKSSAGNGFK
jgi:hypothetical protein